MSPKTKRKVETICLLSGIWFVVALPLPWIINDPDVSQQQLTVIIQMVALISIPFIALAVVWTLKPELAHNS